MAADDVCSVMLETRREHHHQHHVRRVPKRETPNSKFANSQPIFRTFFTVKFSSKLAKYLLKIPLQRLKRLGYSITRYTVSELIVNCDHDLFTKATRYGHCLHHLLPATRPVDHLRPRGHPFQLYPAITDLHKRSFIVRSLYNFM